MENCADPGKPPATASRANVKPWGEPGKRSFWKKRVGSSAFPGTRDTHQLLRTPAGDGDGNIGGPGRGCAGNELDHDHDAAGDGHLIQVSRTAA